MKYIGVIAGKSGEAIVKEVHKWGMKAAIVVGKPNEPGSDIADAIICTDLSNHEDVLKFFYENNVQNVILATGHIFAIELAEFLKNRNFNININPEISKLCNDKYALKDVMQNIGLVTPKYLKVSVNDDLEKVSELFSFPVVVKSIKDYVPPQLVHDIDVLKATAEELYKKEDTIMLEEYIHGNDCSVVVSNTGTEADVVGVLYWSKAKEDKLDGFFESYSEPLSEDVEAKVKAAALKLITNVNVLGMPRVDIIVKDRIPYILEVNSIIFSKNSGSWYTVSSRKKGINTPGIIVKNAMELFAQVDNCKYEKNEESLVIADISSIDNALEDYLLPDVEINIRQFLSDNDFMVSDDEFKKLKKCIAYIVIENPDSVVNGCLDAEKRLVEYAISFMEIY